MFKQSLKWLVLTIGLLIISAGSLACQAYSEESEIPAVYDLRDQNLVTPVKNQNGEKADGTTDIGSTVGLCWAFSSLASLESNLLKQGSTQCPESDEANLSPWYLGNYIGYNEPEYQFNNDTIPDIAPPTSFGYYSFTSTGWGGGGAFWLADYLISGKELPLWKDAPMPTQTMSDHETLANPAVTKGEIYILKDMNILFYDDFTCFDEYQKTIKQSIVEHGAIQSFIHLEPIDMEGVNQQTCQGIEYTNHRFMDKTNHNLFTYEADNLSTILCTHAIAITGWDDNRIIDIDGHTATGAWLVKDSMGSQYQNNGYFWVAYDDMVLGKIMAASLINYTGTDLQHPSCYQTHAGGLSQITSEDEFGEENIIELGKYSYLLNGFKDKDSWAFAKLTLDKPKTVKGVAIFTANRNETVTVNVYNEDEANEPLISRVFMMPEIGYHLLDFEEEIPFESQETIVFGIGFKASEPQKYLPLVYVRSPEINRSIPTYFAYQESGGFTLTPYSEIGEDCTYYLQAVMAH